MTNIKFKRQMKKIAKAPNIVIVGNDARFARMIELEFINNSYNCENFNITNEITGKDNYFFSDIINYCVASQCNLIVLIPDKLEKYENSYGEFINLSRKMLNVNIIFISCDRITHNFNENIIAKNNIIHIRRPFDIEQFFKEVKIFLSKNKLKTEENKIIQINDLSIDEISRMAYYKNEQIFLTKKEFDLLLYLIQHKEEALDRKKIFADVWGFEHIGDTNVVDVFIRHLRNKIDQKYQVKFIHSIRGIGYMLRNK